MNEVIAAKCRIIENKMSQKMQKDQDLLLLQTQLDKKKRKNQYLEVSRRIKPLVTMQHVFVCTSIIMS